MWYSPFTQSSVKSLAALSLGIMLMGAIWQNTCEAVLRPNDGLKARIVQSVLEHTHAAILPLLDEKDKHAYSIEIGQIPNAVVLIPDTLDAASLDIETVSNLTERFRENGIVRIKVIDSNRNVLKSVGISVHIAIKKRVWVVKNTIPAGAALSAKDLMIAEKEVGPMLPYVIEGTQPISQLQARVFLKPGQILDKRRVMEPYAVKPNSQVKLIMNNHQGVNIALDGLALNGGHIGDIIRVKHQMGKARYYMGKVVAPNRVVIDL